MKYLKECLLVSLQNELSYQVNHISHQIKKERGVGGGVGWGNPTLLEQDMKECDILLCLHLLTRPVPPLTCSDPELQHTKYTVGITKQLLSEEHEGSK